MIFEIFGLPRAGKTTLLTCIAQQALRRKPCLLGSKKYKNVYTSFYCKGCKKIDFEELPYFDFSDSLILIDEISLYADNRNFKNFSSDLLYFFKLHGHYNIDLVWCSQSHNDADKKIRDITDMVYYVTKTHIPNVSSIRVIQHNYDFKNRTVSDCYDIQPVPVKLFYRKKWYKFFDSYEKKELPQPKEAIYK